MSVSELEKKAGLKPFSVRNITRGLSQRPSTSNLQAIANALSCTVQDLLGERRLIPLLRIDATTETIENPALFEATIVCVMQQIRAADKKPKFQELILVFQKAYGYAIKLNPPQVDENFIRWILQEIL